MQLPSVGFAALRFTLALAVILLFSPNSFAQHSGGGGGSASAGSSGGGGGSHGGSSGGGGGSASSGGGHSSGGGSAAHSSGGSSSHSSGSASHGSSAHSSSSGAASSHSGASHSNTASNNLPSIHAPRTGSRGQAQTSQKRGFFSFLRHHVPKPLPNPPEPKPEPKQPVAELRRPVCFRGPCPVCPAFHGGSGCGGNIIQNRIERRCPAGESWINGGCLLQTWYQDECGGLRMMMERQAQRMRAAQLDRQITCSIGPWQQCSSLTSSAESEAGFYQELQNRYQECQRRSPTGPRYHGFRVPGYSGGLSLNSLSFELDHP